MYKIGLDLGYGYTKVAAENGIHLCFPSLAAKGQDINLPDLLGAREEYISTVNGTTWYIGKMAAKESRYAVRAFSADDRFNDEAYQAILATALAVTMRDKEDVMLVTGLPLSIYKESMEAFMEFLHNFTANVVIDGKEKNVSLKTAQCFPQAAGIFMNPYCTDIKTKINSGDIVTVIDIGYRTTDVASFEYTGDDYLFMNESSFTVDTGMSTIFRSLGDIVASEAKAFDVPLGAAEAIFNNGVGYINNKPVNYSPIIDELKKKSVAKIAEEYNLKGPKMAGGAGKNAIILAGGGSIPLYEELLKAFPGASTIHDAQFANAVGFVEVAKMLDFSIV